MYSLAEFMLCKQHRSSFDMKAVRCLAKVDIYTITMVTKYLSVYVL